MKRRGILAILLVLVSLSLAWHTKTSPVLEARAMHSGTEFVLRRALVQSISSGWIIEDFAQYEGLYTSTALTSLTIILRRQTCAGLGHRPMASGLPTLAIRRGWPMVPIVLPSCAEGCCTLPTASCRLTTWNTSTFYRAAGCHRLPRR